MMPDAPPRNHYYGADEGIITGNPNTWTAPPTLKSIYDPCPYGYRVPPSDSFDGFSSVDTPWIGQWLTGGTIIGNVLWPHLGWRRAGSAVPFVDGWTHWHSATPSVNAQADFIYFFESGAYLDREPTAVRANHWSIRCIPE